MRWNARRRPPDRSRDEQLTGWTAAAEAAFASGRYELARAEFEAVAEEHRQRLGERPDDVEATDLLAAALNGLGLCLEALRHFDEAVRVFDEALGTSGRAVELRRAAAGPADPPLARTLRTFALVRANAGVELDAAERALDDAVGVHMAVLVANPSGEHLAEAYATELAQARVLARQGRHVEAARVADLARAGHLDGLLDVLRAQRGP